MAKKTQAQIDKKKREIEKRKKIEKAVLKIAAAMPDDDGVKESKAPSTEPGAAPKKA